MKNIKQNIKKVLIKIFPKDFKYKLKENYITDNISVEWWEKHINNLVLQQYSSILKGKVADFGCNHGACTILAAGNPNITEITGFDFNVSAIKEAVKLLDTSGVDKSKVRFVVSSLENIDYSDDYFDGAFMFHTLEHIYSEDREKIFANIKRLLKNEAYLIITTPFERAYDDGIQHVAFFNEASLSGLMTELGFTVVECYRDQRNDEYTPDGHDCLNIMCQNRK